MYEEIIIKTNGIISCWSYSVRDNRDVGPYKQQHIMDEISFTIISQIQSNCESNLSQNNQESIITLFAKNPKS